MTERKIQIALALGSLVVVVTVAWIATTRPAGSPVKRQGYAPNELDIDLLAGTPMPALPTAQPSDESIVSADQALSRGLQGAFFRPKPESISVRLLNHGIMNRLCGGTGGSMPEDELVWAVAFTQTGLTRKDIDGPFYDRQLPPLDWTLEPPAPTATTRPTPTPEAVAGAVSVLVAGQGYLTYQRPLFDLDSTGRHCPTFEMIRALHSLTDTITPLPTEPPHTPVPTRSLKDLSLLSPISETIGATLSEIAIKVTLEPSTPDTTSTP